MLQQSHVCFLMPGQKEHEAWKSFPTQSLQKEKMLIGINLLDT
jgi:hypothetical protein